MQFLEKIVYSAGVGSLDGLVSLQVAAGADHQKQLSATS